MRGVWRRAVKAVRLCGALLMLAAALRAARLAAEQVTAAVREPEQASSTLRGHGICGAVRAAERGRDRARARCAG